MITSRSYFKGSLRIANVLDTAPNSNLVGNSAIADLDIVKYEREALIKLFGYTLYKEFKSKFDIDSNGLWTLKAAESGSKWDDLLNGKEYTLNGNTVYWKGLVYTDSDESGATPDQSLLAYYIYAMFVRDEEFSHAGIGFQAEQAQAADRVSSRSKYAWAYNEFVRMVEFSDNRERSLYDFISDMNAETADTYAEWDYETFNYVNRFGL